ncbi:hypothetical protein P0Y67_16875 [Photobacterium sp. SP02]|uniref:hypothetical protein n=1 Tax=Photobacterium sp. SP02 TaxID=3032280 RepID=UPI00314545C6
MSGHTIKGIPLIQASALSLITLSVIYPFSALADNRPELNTEQMCSQVGHIELAALTPADREAYLLAQADNTLYQVWEIAEKVSTGSTYHLTEKNQLTLQLICEGGFAPAEEKYAVQDAFDHWQHNQPFTFDLCQYITSGVGSAFCANRFAGEQHIERKQRQETAIRQLSVSQQQTIKNAVRMAEDFFEHRAMHEELHGGSSHTAFRIESVANQNDRYLSQILDTLAGSQPEDIPSLDEADSTLSQTYDHLIQRLKMGPIEDFNLEVTAQDVESVQRAWLIYREQTAMMLASLNTNLTIQDWLGVLTAERNRQLSEMLEYMDLDKR